MHFSFLTIAYWVFNDLAYSPQRSWSKIVLMHI